MRFTAACSDLKKGLHLVIDVIPPKTTLPILSHILFEAKNGQLSLNATDLEVTLKTQVHANVESKGSITIPGRLLYDVVREIPDVPLSIVLEESNRIQLKYSRGTYTFFGEDAKNFPKLPAIKVKHEVNFSGKKLQRHIDKTVFAISNDELRPALMGVLFQVQEHEFRAVSTDGHRLVKIIDKGFSTDEAVDDIVIPVKALNLLQKNMGDSGDVKISFATNYVVFDLENASISATLIVGKYPDYEKVIPDNEDKKLVIKRDQFVTSLRTVSVLANKITQQVRISLEPDKITISSQDIDRGEGFETIEADYTGEPMEIGFNSAYLLEVLRHVDTEDVIFRFNTDTSPTLVFPAEQEKNEDLLMLVMPIKLRE